MPYIDYDKDKDGKGFVLGAGGFFNTMNPASPTDPNYVPPDRDNEPEPGGVVVVSTEEASHDEREPNENENDGADVGGTPDDEPPEPDEFDDPAENDPWLGFPEDDEGGFVNVFEVPVLVFPVVVDHEDDGGGGGLMFVRFTDSVRSAGTFGVRIRFWVRFPGGWPSGAQVTLSLWGIRDGESMRGGSLDFPNITISGGSARGAALRTQTIDGPGPPGMGYYALGFRVTVRGTDERPRFEIRFERSP